MSGFRACLAARAAAIFQLSEAPSAVKGTSLKATMVPTTVAAAPSMKAVSSFPVSLNTRLQQIQKQDAFRSHMMRAMCMACMGGWPGNVTSGLQRRAAAGWPVAECSC